jgi:hypothetical protein
MSIYPQLRRNATRQDIYFSQEQHLRNRHAKHHDLFVMVEKYARWELVAAISKENLFRTHLPEIYEQQENRAKLQIFIPTQDSYQAWSYHLSSSQSSQSKILVKLVSYG